MKTYQEHFNDLIEGPWYSKIWKRLRKPEIQIIDQFINETLDLNPNDRELKINRLFMDSKTRPRQWKDILDLLAGANSRDYFEKEMEGDRSRFFMNRN